MTVLFSPLVERACRVAVISHQKQFRKGSELPYISHPVAVVLLLLRAGFDDDEVLAAALLHDVLEDTDYTPTQLRNEFPAQVCDWVEMLSERKLDANGKKNSWRDRKSEHIERVRIAPMECRAIVLADKLHNLGSMKYDFNNGDSVWERFNAGPKEVLKYHRDIVAAAESNATSLKPLANECQELINQLELQKRQ
jgi:guanosine-3',5'-bis(diphosphate) 3'-pyrophosphohydrolase